MKAFKEIKQKHDDVVEKLGWSSLVEFNKLVEAGNKQKAKEFVKSLPKSDPNKISLETLVNYL